MKKFLLVPDAIYFTVDFHDKDLLIPDIKTYVFIGENILGGAEEPTTFFFQGAEKYIALGKWEPPHDAVEFDVLMMQEDFLEYVVDYSGLQEQIELMKKGGARYYP